MIETRVLDDVLSLPYGFETYSLLSRWNPLNFQRPLPKENTGKNILVVGLSPAGFNLNVKLDFIRTMASILLRHDAALSHPDI